MDGKGEEVVMLILDCRWRTSKARRIVLEMSGVKDTPMMDDYMMIQRLN